MKRTVCSPLPLLLKHLYPLDDDVSLFLKRSFSVRLSLSHYFYINAFKGFLKIDRVIQVDTKWRQITVPLFLGVTDFDAIFWVSNSHFLSKKAYLDQSSILTQITYLTSKFIFDSNCILGLKFNFVSNYIFEKMIIIMGSNIFGSMTFLHQIVAGFGLNLGQK